MALGPGKYDRALTEARKLCGATSALLIVVDGEQGGGFSCQGPLEHLAGVPAMLRHIAAQIEADLKRGTVL